MSVRRLAEIQPESFAFTPENRAWADQQIAKSGARADAFNLSRDAEKNGRSFAAFRLGKSQKSRQKGRKREYEQREHEVSLRVRVLIRRTFSS